MFRAMPGMAFSVLVLSFVISGNAAAQTAAVQFPSANLEFPPAGVGDFVEYLKLAGRFRKGQLVRHPSFGLGIVASPRHADVLLVTGAVTTRMRDALLAAYNAMPEPRRVAALGDCALGCGVLGLRDELAGPGVSFSDAERGAIEVHGLTAEQVGDTAAAAGIALHELTPQQASLEEAFMDLTRDDLEFAAEVEAVA